MNEKYTENKGCGGGAGCSATRHTPYFRAFSIANA